MTLQILSLCEIEISLVENGIFPDKKVTFAIPYLTHINNCFTSMTSYFYFTFGVKIIQKIMFFTGLQ